MKELLIIKYYRNTGLVTVETELLRELKDFKVFANKYLLPGLTWSKDNVLYGKARNGYFLLHLKENKQLLYLIQLICLLRLTGQFPQVTGYIDKLKPVMDFENLLTYLKEYTLVGLYRKDRNFPEIRQLVNAFNKIAEVNLKGFVNVLPESIKPIYQKELMEFLNVLRLRNALDKEYRIINSQTLIDILIEEFDRLIGNEAYNKRVCLYCQKGFIPIRDNTVLFCNSCRLIHRERILKAIQRHPERDNINELKEEILRETDIKKQTLLVKKFHNLYPDVLLPKRTKTGNTKQ
jgi:hypothetical protein